jgi:hypothetical protein
MVVFAHDGEQLRFHPARRLTRDDVAEVVAVVAQRINRLLRRRGLAATSEESGTADTWADEAPVLAGLAAASVQGLVALGPRAGARVARYGSPPEAAAPVTLGPCHANVGASIYMRGSWSGRVIASGSSGCAAIRCGRRSRRRGCASTGRGRSGSRCGISGRMAPRISGSSRRLPRTTGRAGPAAPHQPRAVLRHPGAAWAVARRPSSPRPDQNGPTRRPAPAPPTPTEVTSHVAGTPARISGPI